MYVIRRAEESVLWVQILEQLNGNIKRKRLCG